MVAIGTASVSRRGVSVIAFFRSFYPHVAAGVTLGNVQFTCGGAEKFAVGMAGYGTAGLRSKVQSVTLFIALGHAVSTTRRGTALGVPAVFEDDANVSQVASPDNEGAQYKQ